MRTTVSIANEKGGVAKTTTTISLGACLAEIGLKVLLVDLDAQANLSLALGVECSRSQPNIAKVLLEGMPPSFTVQETAITGLYLIPAAADMGLVERFLPARADYEGVLSTALQEPGLDFDYILLDCPPFLGAATYNAMVASDLLIMPTQPEYFSINALRSMMSMVRRVRSQGNARLTYRLLITMFDRRNRIHRTLSEQLRTTFGSGVLETMIETDTRLRESAIAGLPIIYHAPKSRSSIQYRALAQEILTYVKETNSQPA